MYTRRRLKQTISLYLHKNVCVRVSVVAVMLLSVAGWVVLCRVVWCWCGVMVSVVLLVVCLSK